MSDDAHRRLVDRERAGRKEAERLLEEKSRELYLVNEYLASAKQAGEKLVARRTKELLRKNEELELARATADSANAAKSSFLAQMSHEIRTPLTSIIGFADVLKERLQDPEDLHTIRIVQRNGLHLLSLISDILDFSRIEAGEVKSGTIVCDLGAITDELLASMQPLAKQQGLEFRVQLAELLPANFQSDPLRLKQILLNLISNAIKFTVKGEVTLTISHVSGPSPNVVFDITDTGIGVERSAQSSIFEAFKQADDSAARSFEGAGLGLAICVRLARIMGGTLILRESSKSGSTFRLMLPAPVQAILSPVRGAAVSSSSVLYTVPVGLRVLLVDDSADNRRLLTLFLKKAGAKIETANDGAEAVALLDNSPDGFDIILMDMDMPVMDGWDATRLLRAQGFELPIVALTAHVTPEAQSRCFEVGCSGYLTKPIVRSALFAAIARNVAQIRSEVGPQD